MALMLSMARKTPQANASMKQGKWERSKFTGSELYEKTLAIIGLGRIGSLVAERARGFGMKLIGYDPYISEERAAKMGVTLYATVDELLPLADFITVHLPKTKDTIGMFGPERFAMMKDGVYVVNTARGGIYQIPALADAVRSGKVGGAAHRRLRGGAVHRFAAHGVRQRHPHAAPGRVDGGGAGPRRRADRRVRGAGPRGPHGPDRRQRRAGLAGGHGEGRSLHRPRTGHGHDACPTRPRRRRGARHHDRRRARR